MQEFERGSMAAVWVVEHSKKQGCFHVDTLDRTVEQNMVAFLNGADPGYITLGLFPSQETAFQFIQRLERVAGIRSEGAGA